MDAFLAPSPNPLSYNRRVYFLNSPRYPVLVPHRYNQLSLSHTQRLSLRCSAGLPNARPFGELNRIKTYLEKLAERIWQNSPDSVKHFPWKKAEETVLERLEILGQKALKLAIVAFFLFSSLSDIAFSFSRNKELMIPLGLFAGCALADFLKETSLEMFKNKESVGKEEGDLIWHLIGIGSFFVLLRLISLYLTVQGRAFLSHVSNGGLMEVIWLGKKFLIGNDAMNEKEASQLN